MATQSIFTSPDSTDDLFGHAAAHDADAAGAARILIADDQPGVRFALRLLLKTAGYETQAASGPAEVVHAVEAGDADVVILDLNYTRDTTCGGEGLELITRIRQLDATLPILAMTAWGNIEVAVEAMRRGAADFVQKPWSSGQLLEKLGTLARLSRSARRLQFERQAEREGALEVQRKLLTFDLPEDEGCQISGSSRAAHLVGGDFCRVERTAPGQFAISIADVAGKGVPGALIAATLLAAQKPLVAQDLPPAALCSALNRAMADVTPAGRFISFFHARLDLGSKRLCYSNAGHNPPWLISSDGTVQSLSTGGAVLGHFEQWEFEQAEVQCRSGDRLVLFTDGIVEAESPECGEFGAERLAQVAVELRQLPADAMQAALLERVSQHCGGAFQDDATLVVIAIA